MEKGNELIKKMAKSFDEIVEVGEKIFENGISADDVMHLPALVSPAKDLYDVIKNIKELGEEAKDLDWNELGEIIEIFKN